MKTISSQLASLQTSGAPRINRLFLNGAAGAKITEGDVFTIDADGVTDTYEFRNSTPPLGGTAGNIWIYNGANAAASRVNLITAVNRVVDANVVTRTLEAPTAGTNLINVRAYTGSAPTALTFIECTTVGDPNTSPTVVLLTASSVPTSAADVWDSLDFYGGFRSGNTALSTQSLTVTANLTTVNKFVEFWTPFGTPYQGATFVSNRSRSQDEEFWEKQEFYFELVLNGGASPNNQVNDIIDVLVVGDNTL
jgi:hypothetical protein